MTKPSNFWFWLNMIWSVVGSLCVGFLVDGLGYSHKLSIGLAIFAFLGTHGSFWFAHWVMTSDRFNQK